MRNCFSDPSFVDAFESAKLNLATRRALACVCKAQRVAQARFFKGRLCLRVHAEDCTQANALFVVGPLAKREPQCALQVSDTMCLQPLAQLPFVLNFHPDMPIVGSFFLGRALAYRDSGVVAIHLRDPIHVAHINVRDIARDKLDMLVSRAHDTRALPVTFEALVAGPFLACAIRRLRHNMCSDSANLSRIPLDDEGARWMASRTFCRVPETLKTLDLSGAISSRSWGLFKPLTRLVNPLQLPRLENLDLSNNHLDVTGIDMLARAIASDANCLNRLRHLNLRNTGLTDAKLHTLAQVFEGWDSLAWLDISSNVWKGGGLQSFMDHGHHLRGLTKLDLSDSTHINTCWFLRLAKWIHDRSGWLYIEKVTLAPIGRLASSRHDGRSMPTLDEADQVLRAAIEGRKAELAWTAMMARVEHRL